MFSLQKGQRPQATLYQRIATSVSHFRYHMGQQDGCTSTRLCGDRKCLTSTKIAVKGKKLLIISFFTLPSNLFTNKAFVVLCSLNTLREDRGLDIQSPDSPEILDRALPDKVTNIVLRLLKSDLYCNEKCFGTVTSRLNGLQKKTCQV